MSAGSPRDNDIHMSAWSAVRLVAGRELTTRLTSRPFRITTAITVVVIVGFTIVMSIVNGRGGPDATVGFTHQNAALAAPLKVAAKSVGMKVETRVVPSDASGRTQVKDGKLDALMQGSGGSVSVVVDQKLGDKLEGAMNVLARNLALDQEIRSFGHDPAQVAAKVGAAHVGVTALTPPKHYDGQQLALGIIAGILIYMSLMFNGQAVSQGVVEEKSSRVVELLLSTIRPWQLMAGKVLGIGIVGLLQMLVIGVAGAIAGRATGTLTISLSATVGTVVWLVVWFLLGFLMYALAFAGVGALVSRQEDIGGVTAPVLMFVIVGYVIGISVLPSDPSNGMVEVLSIIPMFAPTLMPMRLAMGGVPIWEAVLSVALVAGMIPVLVWLAGRIYRNAVMRTGARVKLSDALHAA